MGSLAVSLLAACGGSSPAGGSGGVSGGAGGHGGGTIASGGAGGAGGRAGGSGGVAGGGLSGAAGAGGGPAGTGGGHGGGGVSGTGGGAGGAPAVGGGAGGGHAGSAGGMVATGGSEGGAGGAATGGRGGAAGGSQWVLGYYVGYQINDYPISAIDWSALTHIAFAPLLVKADRTLDFGFSDSNGTGEADAKALAQAAHAHGVKALLMLGGAGAGVNIAAAADASHRATFVQTLLAGLATLGYDGIDLDWEDSVALADLAALGQALRAAKPDIVLTYPAGALNANFPTVDPQLVTLAGALDRFNVQTYYPSTAYAGSGWSSWFSSPLSGMTSTTPVAIDDTLQRYAAAGIPRAKLGMGIAFYAICYTGGITGPRQATDGTTQAIVGGDNDYPLSRFYAAGGTFAGASTADMKRDTVAAEPYLSLAAAVNDPGCGAPTRYITYEDETSIAAKGAWSKANGYGGIIIWTLGEGYLPAGAAGGRPRNALTQALKAGFLD